MLRASSSRFVRPALQPRSHICTPFRRWESLIASNRVLRLREEVGPDTKVDLKQIMDDLRDLELLDLLENKKPRSGNGWKDAARALYPLYHKVDTGRQAKVSFAELEDALAPIFTMPWGVIRERLLDGKVRALSSLSPVDAAKLRFLQIFNVGPARAQAIADAGCRTFDDVLDMAKKAEPKVKISKSQQVGLELREDLNRLIPREELVELEKKIKKAVSAAGRGFQMEILGSYRRGSAFCSDVDLVIRHERYATKDQTDEGKELLGKIVDQLVEHGLVKPEHQLARGASKFMGFIRLNAGSRFRRIDIRLVPHASYPYTLLGGSGDSLLMKFLRWKAKRMGWTLNEYGMGKKYSAVDANPNGFKPGTLKEVKDEQEIFQLLKLPYLKPEERDYRIWKEKYLVAGVKEVEELHKMNL
ncbi:hypothetical protein NBRC10512_005695 [Rhodotorula toruloides]|uniref:DNA polymerase n=2 Tax=Rhodotorula toruloides TaxID=5286 RepID=A0A061AH63_RHOTO|nr:DNA polymerase beta subunit [Rhodotorula toruloides NP11]EMS19084.1 DNA polymerase beta subunit [Rhodotorula toruloides NP11]CDR36906.1 RHTO0S02e08372g1_1 [Rhodotorula toruloides]